jgi:hypothetical protein
MSDTEDTDPKQTNQEAETKLVARTPAILTYKTTTSQLSESTLPVQQEATATPQVIPEVTDDQLMELLTERMVLVPKTQLTDLESDARDLKQLVNFLFSAAPKSFEYLKRLKELGPDGDRVIQLRKEAMEDDNYTDLLLSAEKKISQDAVRTSNRLATRILDHPQAVQNSHTIYNTVTYKSVTIPRIEEDELSERERQVSVTPKQVKMVSLSSPKQV